MLYAMAKLIHVVAVILWIGPPLGAYALVVSAYRGGDKARIVWAERECERVLVIEHVAFFLLLASGVMMTVSLGEGALSMSWLRNKLVLVALVVLFELFDMWLAHHVFKRVFAAAEPFDTLAWQASKRWRRALYVAAVPVGLVFIPGILFFAVVKPG